MGNFDRGPRRDLAQGKCIKQLAPSAAMNARFHSSRQKASQFTAGTVTGKEEGSDSSDLVGQ